MAMSPRHPMLALAVLLLATGAPLSKSAQAQYSGGPMGGPSGGTQQVASAQANLGYAQANVDRLKDRAERSLSHDRDWTAAKAAVAEATKNRDAVRAQAKAQIMASPAYQELQKHMSATSSDAEQGDARAQMAMMVWDGLQNSSDCQAAQVQLDQAQANQDAIWKDYENRVLANDPEWTRAIAARNAARAQVSAAIEAQLHATRSGSSMRSSSGSRSSYGGSSSRSSGRSGSRSSRGSGSYY